MKTLLVIAADINPDDFGGAEYHFVEVLKRISSDFKRVTVFVGSSIKIRSEFLKNTNIDFIAVHYPRITNFVGITYILFALPKVMLFCLKNRPDIIWAKQEFPQGVVGGLMKLIFKSNLIVTSQSARLYKDELVVSGFLKTIEWLFALIGQLLVSFSFRQADIVSAVSSFSASEAVKLGARKVFVVPNGIDLKRFKFTKKTSRAGHLSIVTTSSLIPRNGIDTLIQACARLPKTIKWDLKIAGTGRDKGLLEDIVKRLGLEDEIHFLGYVDNTEIPKLLSDSDIFIRVSNAEGFGSSFLEAMAVGTPTIATPVGGIVDFLGDRKTGWLVPPASPDKLQSTIIEIINNPQKVSSVVLAARKLVVQNYSWDNVARKFQTEVLEYLHVK